FDEAHYLKAPRARRTRASRRLVKKASSVIGLSGTPLTNRPIELWSILRIIRPDLFPSREEYAWAYCKPRYTPWGWRYDGATNLKQLNRILRSECMIRRLKKDVLLELPAKTRRIVPFRLASYKEYRRADNEFLVWLKETSPSRAMRAKKSLALVKVGYLLRLVAKLKMEWTKQWIEEFFIAHPGEKLVALTMHTFVIDQLKERFPSSVVIDGRVVGRKRDETVRKFQSNRRVNLLLGNWKAAGVGITLHAASNAAALDFPWSPGDLLQGEDRIHRIGQKKKVVIHYLTALGTIEEKLVRILRKKSDILDAVLNGEEDAQSFNIFEDLLEIIRTEKL
ncbi:MAG TPA: DEAD/DEAH box helicase, partial [Pyrinomonadaceae bacterium]